MDKYEHTILNEFKCCGTTMISDIMGERATCVMTELDFNRIIVASGSIAGRERRNLYEK